jgi:hypothetical protein
VSRGLLQRLALAVVACCLIAATAWTTGSSDRRPSSLGVKPVSSSLPPPGGYFQLVRVGGWRSLPSGYQCRRLIHYSTWEPRPANTKRNSVMPDPAAVRAAFAARPRATGGSYDPRWDSWLLPRVDGQFAGTTDEIFQWAACKWGLPDDLLRAIAVRQSTWYQHRVYPSGRCVTHFGCGDAFEKPSRATRVYCATLARSGYDYQRDFGPGICPKSFSIVDVLAWHDPAWGRWPGNQNGTFPFSRDSTAFAVDYMASQLRGCYEGWGSWLKRTSDGKYAAGDLLGCVGTWFAGEWHTDVADRSIRRVQQAMQFWPWLDPTWVTNGPGCNARYGCPGPDPLNAGG